MLSSSKWFPHLSTKAKFIYLICTHLTLWKNVNPTYLFKTELFVTALGTAASDSNQLQPGEFADIGESVLVAEHLCPGHAWRVVITYTFVDPAEMTPSCGGHIVHHTLGETVIWLCHTRG